MRERRDDGAPAIHYQRHPEQRALARVSKDTEMPCRLAVIGGIAVLGLVACDKPAPLDPVDQARTALQARFGPDYELHFAVTEQSADHVVVCGRAGTPPSASQSMLDSEFVVVDGQVIEDKPQAGAARLVAVCRSKLPEGPPMKPRPVT